jgi:Arc/MetJ-type ribon-helix-helix transcriptional regulator
MIIQLPEDLEQSVHAEVDDGHFASAEELVAEAVRSFLRQPATRQADPGSGSIGAMSDAGDELDEIVADTYRRRREETWRDVEVE